MMPLEQKKKALDKFFEQNHQDYSKIIEKICNNRKRHQDLSNEEKLTIIYLNIFKRLESIPDRFFVDVNQFRSILIQTTQSQISWTTSDISAYKANLSLKADEITTENADVLITANHLNNQPLITSQDDYDDDDTYEKQLEFITTTYPELLTDLVDKVTYEIIVTNHHITGPALANKIGISVAAATTILRVFKEHLRFVYKNYNYIRNKANFQFINQLHPSIRQTIINCINKVEEKNDITLTLTEGYISRKEQNKRYNEGLTQIKGGNSKSQYGLEFKLTSSLGYIQDDFIQLMMENNLIYTAPDKFEYDMPISEIKDKYKNKQYVQHNYIKL